MAADNLPCPVCRAQGTAFLIKADGKDYYRCEVCEARFMHPRHFLSPEEEHAHYQTHENDPSDPRYRKFLSKLIDPLMERLPSGSSGLDYGCGPGPALAAMFSEAGHDVSLYDPFFAPGAAQLQCDYDFITCSEAVEHFHRPADEFDRFNSLLRPGGWLGIMTSFQTEDSLFANWHYRKDPTHVVFYRAATFHLIAVQRGWTCEIPVKDVVLMRRP